MKRHLDKVGSRTSKTHDTENKTFNEQKLNLHIKKIECYYSSEGIYGFFPFFDDPQYDDLLLQENKSYYTEFMDNIEPKLVARASSVKSALEHMTLKFKQGEVIESIIAVFDEYNKKITAIKLKTSSGLIHVVGHKPDLNNKPVTYISREDYFMPGFKTDYLPENNVCFLSYIGVYYDAFNNYKFYYKMKKPSQFWNNLYERIERIENFIVKILKFLVLIVLLLLPVYFYLKSRNNLYRGEILEAQI